MSTYTPFFPPTDIISSRPRHPISSNSSGTSTSGSQASLKVSYSARISRSHLALASVSDYIHRPPSPTSAAVDIKRVTLLRRKFRLAIDATYRDTSSGKWAHVYEMARLGSTRGRWQGMCSGRSAHSPCKARKQDHQGKPTENANADPDPYPRPPVPVFDLQEIRERVENWQADVLPSPSPQVHCELNRSTHLGDAKQSSQLNFPIVKQRRSDVAKAMKRKDSPPCKDHSTSRFFRGVADPEFRDTDGENRDAAAVTTRPSEPSGPYTLHSGAGGLGEHPDSSPKTSSISGTATGQQNIQQVSELFLPPSFPSHLETSTPPPFPTAKVGQSRLMKPPEIPRNEDLCFSASLPSPLPFPVSQAIEENQGHGSQPNGSSSLSERKRPLPDSFSPVVSPNRSFKQPPAFDKPHDDVHQRDGNIFSAFSPPEHVPVIDLRQLTQRSRKSHHPSQGINPMTPKSKDKGKGRVLMTVDISPSRLSSLSPPWTSRSLARIPSPHIQTPPHSQTNYTQYADAFAHTAVPTQPPREKGLVPQADGRAFTLSPGSQVNAETHELPVNDILDRGVPRLPAR